MRRTTPWQRRMRLPGENEDGDEADDGEEEQDGEDRDEDSLADLAQALTVTARCLASVTQGPGRAWPRRSERATVRSLGEPEHLLICAHHPQALLVVGKLAPIQDPRLSVSYVKVTSTPTAFRLHSVLWYLLM